MLHLSPQKHNHATASVLVGFISAALFLMLVKAGVATKVSLATSFTLHASRHSVKSFDVENEVEFLRKLSITKRTCPDLKAQHKVFTSNLSQDTKHG